MHTRDLCLQPKIKSWHQRSIFVRPRLSLLQLILPFRLGEGDLALPAAVKIVSPLPNLVGKFRCIAGGNKKSLKV